MSGNQQHDLIMSTPIPYVKNPLGEWRLAMITMEWHRSRLRLCMPNNYRVRDVRADGMEIGEARNYVAEQARKYGAQWIFFVDWDVLMPPNCLKQLIYRTNTHPGFDVYSGIYCIKEHPACPIIVRKDQPGWFHDWQIGDVLSEDIAAVPMGCALIRVSAFDRITHTPENPWFKTHCLDDENGVHGVVSEDVWFCNRLRFEADGKILVDCSSNTICGHISHETAEIFQLEADSPAMKGYPQWLEKELKRTNLVTKESEKG